MRSQAARVASSSGESQSPTSRLLASNCFFAIGLLNGILLFSLNLATTVLKTLLPSLALNFITGYLLANLVDVRWAVTGLVVGGFTFMILSTIRVVRAIQKPDYAYYLGGY